MCQKAVYQTFLDLHQMQEELRNLRKLQNNCNTKQNKISTSNPQTSEKEHDVYKNHFSEVGKILSRQDPEHDRDELCWVGEKQVSVNDELSKLLQKWASTNQEIKKVQKDPGLKDKEDALYKEFFDNANKITVDLMGAAGKAAYLYLNKDGEYEEVDVEEMRKDAAKQIGK